MELGRKRFVSIREFSEQFDYSEKYIRSLIQKGVIPAIRLNTPGMRGGDWRIDLDSVEFEKNEIIKSPIHNQYKNTRIVPRRQGKVKDLLEKISKM